MLTHAECNAAGHLVHYESMLRELDTVFTTREMERNPGVGINLLAFSAEHNLVPRTLGRRDLLAFA